MRQGSSWEGKAWEIREEDGRGQRELKVSAPALALQHTVSGSVSNSPKT